MNQDIQTASGRSIVFVGLHSYGQILHASLRAVMQFMQLHAHSPVTKTVDLTRYLGTFCPVHSSSSSTSTNRLQLMCSFSLDQAGAHGNEHQGPGGPRDAGELLGG